DSAAPAQRAPWQAAIQDTRGGTAARSAALRVAKSAPDLLACTATETRVEPWELIAREQIRDLVSEYAHCADGGRFDQLVALFAPAGVLETPAGHAHSGREAIRAFLGGTKTDLAAATTAGWIRHHVSTLRLALTSASEASGSAYFFVITERGPDHWGRYRDRY